MSQKNLKVIKIKKRILTKDLKFIFLLLLLTTVLLATQNTLNVNSDTEQFQTIRNSNWFWTDTEVLSDESNGNSEFPEIMADSYGNLHVVWWDPTNYLGAGTDRDIFYRRWDADSKSWTSVQVVSTSSLESMEPDLAVDSANNVHFVWEENYQTILYRKWITSTQSWSSITPISTESTATLYSPSISIDSSDNIHVIWCDNTDILGAGGDDDLFYKLWNETKQAWSTTYLVTPESNQHSYIPKQAIDSEGNIHVVWYDQTDYLSSGIDQDIFYKYLDASTKTWQPAEVLSYMSTDISYDPDIAVDSLDNIHIVWSDESQFDGSKTDSDIFYVIYDKVASNWTVPEVISDVGDHTSYFPSIDIDLEDNVYVSWEDASAYDGADTDLDTFYRMYSSHTDTWSRTKVISTDSSSPSRFATIAVGKYGSVNIVWSDYTNLSYYGYDQDIFFKRLIGPPTEPTLATIFPDLINTDTLNLEWSEVKGVRQYYVYRDTSYIWSVDHLDPIYTITTETQPDTLPSTGIYYYVVVADNVHYNSSISNCVAVEYKLAHIQEFAISISMMILVVMLVITIRIRRKRFKE
ncbi:MAG: hypothetical protein ACFFDS_06780 [Candidatus Thorarchaeota archaeon]